MSTPPPPLIASGYFGPTGDPLLKIKLCGLFNPAGIELEAVIDTGFSGFLSMPLIQAFPVGLTLCGTTTVQFADGTTGNKLLAMGAVVVGSITKSGVIILQESPCSVLLGMDFIRTFNIAMVMTKSDIALFDHDWWDKAVKAAASATASPAPSALPAPANSPNPPTSRGDPPPPSAAPGT